MKNILKSLLFLGIITAILILSLLGSTQARSFVVPVGNLQLAEFENGLSLYQLYKGSYYTFSPFNDYEVIGGVKKSFITKSDIENKSYKTDIQTNSWDGIVYSLENFMGVYHPKVTFKNGNKISYEAFVSGNSLTLSRTFSLHDNSRKHIFGSTLSFEINDIVFDNSGNLVNLVDQKEIDEFSKREGITLSPNLDETEITLNRKIVYIASKNIPTIIAIKASKNQIIKVDWNARLIRIEETVTPKNGNYKTFVNIKVFKNMKEAIRGI